jgi:hypothetical protein
MDHIYVIPGFEFRRDIRMRLRVSCPKICQSFARKYNTPTKRIVRPISLEYGYLM